jgi:ribA/ribD-fused uncharacterized protein
MVRKKVVATHPQLTDPRLAFIDLTNRRYANEEVLLLHRNMDPCGGLLNMTSRYPITVNGIRVPSAEHLYQICRYPNLPDVQQGILDNPNPLMMKRWSSQFRDQGLTDWYQIKAIYMNWTLHAKFACNFDAIAELLEGSGKRKIIEVSPDGNWWGCVREIRGDDSSAFVGANVFGQLVMRLRDEFRTKLKKELLVVEPLDVPNFLLLGKPIQPIVPGGVA